MPAMNIERTCIEKDFAALEHMRRARMNFGDRICTASAHQVDEVLEILRQESMFEFAEFYFAIKAMDLCGADDIALLADMHNLRIDSLLRNAAAMGQRKLRKDRLLDAIFSSDTRPRLEHCWRETPGALDQSNLARFLVAQMSAETTRKLAVASEAAGFLIRRDTVFNTKVVVSTGVMENVFGQCMREMREAIAKL